MELARRSGPDADGKNATTTHASVDMDALTAQLNSTQLGFRVQLQVLDSRNPVERNTGQP
jgi:hypothetical protein